jgi:putative two-component system response regulator
MMEIRDLILQLSRMHSKAKIPFMVLDSSFTIVTANETFLKTFKVSREELGKKKADFLFYQRVSGIAQFSEMKLDDLVNGAHILLYHSEGIEISFNVDVFLIGELNRKSYYYALMRDSSVMEVQFIEKSLHALMKASLLKDNDTANHLDRVNAYAREISEYLFRNKHDQFPEISQFFIEKIATVAALHDIGKIGTPDSILTKPTDLTDEEFDIIKEHTINGAFILSSLAGPMARDVALFHHERWDGTGYPYNLRGTDIPLAARIVALADVYDALRMARFYKNPLPHEDAKKIILSEGGGHFDPQIIDVFKEINQKFARIFNTWGDEKVVELLEELSSI